MVVVVIITAGVWFYTSSKNAPFTPPAPTPTASPSQTVSQGLLKTYTNTQFGYSLKYPASWGATTELVDSGIVLFSNPQYLQMRLQNPQTFTKEDYAMIDTAVYKYNTNTAGGAVTQNTDLTIFPAKIYSGVISAVPTTVGGVPGVLVTRKRMVLKPGLPFGMQNCPSAQAPCEIQDGTTQQVWAKIKGGIFFIEYTYGRGYTDSTGALQTFQQVVSSLQFSQ